MITPPGTTAGTIATPLDSYRSVIYMAWRNSWSLPQYSRQYPRGNCLKRHWLAPVARSMAPLIALRLLLIDAHTLSIPERYLIGLVGCYQMLPRYTLITACSSIRVSTTASHILFYINSTDAPLADIDLLYCKRCHSHTVSNRAGLISSRLNYYHQSCYLARSRQLMPCHYHCYYWLRWSALVIDSVSPLTAAHVDRRAVTSEHWLLHTGRILNDKAQIQQLASPSIVGLFINAMAYWALPSIA